MTEDEVLQRAKTMVLNVANTYDMAEAKAEDRARKRGFRLLNIQLETIANYIGEAQRAIKAVELELDPDRDAGVYGYRVDEHGSKMFVTGIQSEEGVDYGYSLQIFNAKLLTMEEYQDFFSYTQSIGDKAYATFQR